MTVTGARSGAGASTVALGLARSLAESGRRTLLVDGNLRHPRIADGLGLAAAPGLAELCSGNDRGAVAQPTGLDGLSVLAAGATEDAGATVAGRGLQDSLAAARRSYDAIVVDTPAILEHADAEEFARLGDQTLVVADIGNVSPRDLRAALDRATLASPNHVAMVANRADRDDA